MMSRNVRLRSELNGAIAKRPPHAKNQLSVPGSFFNQIRYTLMNYKGDNISKYVCPTVIFDIAIFTILMRNDDFITK